MLVLVYTCQNAWGIAGRTYHIVDNLIMWLICDSFRYAKSLSWKILSVEGSYFI